MKKTLLFHAALPIGLAVVYYIALQFRPDHAFAVTFAAAFAVIAAVLAFRLITFAAAFAAIAAVFAVLSAASAAPTVTSTIVFITFAAAFAVIAAFVAKNEVYPKIGMMFLIFHNFLWMGAIGLAAYFGVTPAGGGMLAAAIIFPLMLLAYECALHKKGIGAETSVSR